MTRVGGHTIAHVPKKQYLCTGFENETRIILIRTTFAPRT